MPSGDYDLEHFEKHERPSRPNKRRRSSVLPQNRTKMFLFLGAFAIAAILLIVCIVMLINAIKEPKKTKPKPGAESTISTSASAPIVSGVETPAVTGPAAPDPTVWNLMLVSPTQPLSAEYTPPETRVVSPAGHTFDTRAADELERMVRDCNAVSGHSLTVISGMRGFTTQTKNNNHQKEILKYSGLSAEEIERQAALVEPPAGQSDHHTGLSVDFINSSMQEPSASFKDTAEYAWLMEHCTEYGFILRYPEGKEEVTGQAYKPYTFRYVGAEEAKTITGNGITLDEYAGGQAVAPPAEAAAQSTPAA